jgi:hypothetical protein
MMNMKKLMVHENKRYLMWDDGTPFFYLGDTAWEMLHGLTRAEIEYYLSVRAQQGYNVIQTVALAEFEGLGKLWELAYEDIDAAMALGLKMCLEDLKSYNTRPHSVTESALEYYKRG